MSCKEDTTLQFDSPYKKSLSEIKYVSQNNDLDDFRTPKPIKVQKKIQEKNTNKQKKTKPKSKVSRTKSTQSALNKNSIFRATQDNFGHSDVNPDHLQMALALSKSSYAAEHPELSKAVETFPTFLSPEKIPKGKTTLERYGFKSERNKLYPELRREYFEVPKKNKNSKFRFITPTLNVRSNEERQSIISSKISLILYTNISSSDYDDAEVENVDELISEILSKFNGKYSIFAANRYSLEEKDGRYYIKDLIASPMKSKCGCLLKKFEDIPGREKSPVRNEGESQENDNNIPTFSLTSSEISGANKQQEEDICTVSTSSNSTSFSQNLQVEHSINRDCTSPDLFESEDENEYMLESPDVLEDFSQSLLSPSKKRLNLTGSWLSNSSENKKIPFSDALDTNSTVKEDNTIINIPQSVVPLSEDEDTEELYLNSLKSKEEIILQNSPLQKHNRKIFGHFSEYSEDEDNEQLFMKLTQNSPSKRQMEGITKEPLDEKKEVSNINSLETNDFVIVDLTISSSPNSCSHEDNEQLFMKLTQNSPSKKPMEGITKDLLDKNKEELNISSVQTNDFAVDLTISSSSNSCSLPPSDKITESLNKSGTYPKDIDTNFEMSPLLLKESIDVENHNLKTIDPINIETTFSEKLSLPHAGNIDSRTSVDMENLDNCSGMLNITDYVNHILNQNHSEIGENEDNTSDHNLRDKRDDNDLKSNSPDDHILPSSQESCSQESIVISDEELNYSSVHSKNTNNCFYSLSDNEDICKSNENNVNSIDVNEVYTMHSALKNKYRKESISTLVHSRISELRGKTLLSKSSLTRVFLDNSFNEVLENTNIMKAIENETDPTVVAVDEFSADVCGTVGPTSSKNTEDKCTPEKCTTALVSSSANSDTTPDNLIIKTKNITPLANYDEMDTPGITKELQKFGLKPLKRQRGVKLLKYLYDCTHPLVGSADLKEYSSEDDEERVIKKRKRSSSACVPKSIKSVTSQDMFECGKNCIEIIGDALLINENLNELIFERKYSVRISSCRIPLQIVWYNFLSINAGVKENILLYEPLQLEVLHAMLKQQTGCKFHIQDLLTFFDRKCITIRTAQGPHKRKRKT